MVFHSINISKVILNSFHCFGSLDYVLESSMLLVGIFIIGVGKTFFFGSNFYMELVSFDDLLWMLAPCGKKKHVLRVDFMMSMHCFTLLFIVCTLGV